MHSSSSSGVSLVGSIGTLLLMLVFGYFFYHVISGENGLLSMIDIQKKVAEAKTELDYVSAEKLRLENRVALLRDESVDPDLLDEQARRLLGYVAEDETMYVDK
ncbi:MAG: septum formation initiator [Alphaproteobacteria bacterium CG11_big_fil_rev_8_21_14_0_20_39_49]|nr:MAG: septum formation initiator [Alphaproteobacteria bacterium CG11_big_fil_rev_8_21_14_0_20_39_49]